MPVHQRFSPELRSQILREWKENPDPAARKALALKHDFSHSLINYWRKAGHDPGHVPTKGPRAVTSADTAKYPPPPPMAPLKPGTKRWFDPEWKKKAVLFIDHSPSKQDAEAQISITDTQYREWKRAYFPAPMGDRGSRGIRRTPEEKSALFAEMRRLAVTEGTVEKACKKLGFSANRYYELQREVLKMGAGTNGHDKPAQNGSRSFAQIRADTEQRAAAVAKLRSATGLSIEAACKQIGIVPSAYYAALRRAPSTAEGGPRTNGKTHDLVAAANVALRHASAPGIQTEVGAAVKECLRRLRMLGIDLTSLNTAADGEKSITYTTTETFQL